jgi:drug/metabolite transporter (DMT)-like permease
MISISGLRPIIYLLVLGASWGLYFSLLKIAVLSGISYIGIAALTTVGVCVGMVLIAVIRKRAPKLDRQHIFFYLACALTGYLLPMVVELYVISHMPAGVLALIVSMSPLATMLIAWIMKTDHLNRYRVMGMLLGAIAIFAILLPDVHSVEEVSWYWLLLATVVPVCYAFYHNIVARFWPADSDTYQVACGEALIASLLIAVFSLFHWQWQDVQSWNQGHTVILIMSVIALVDIYIYFELIRQKGPVFTSHANYFMVISGVFWGMILFAERPSSLMWVSALMLTVSLYLIGYGKEGQDSGSAS